MLSLELRRCQRARGGTQDHAGLEPELSTGISDAAPTGLRPGRIVRFGRRRLRKLRLRRLRTRNDPDEIGILVGICATALLPFQLALLPTLGLLALPLLPLNFLAALLGRIVRSWLHLDATSAAFGRRQIHRDRHGRRHGRHHRQSHGRHHHRRHRSHGRHHRRHRFAHAPR